MSSNPLRLKYLLQKYLDNSCSQQDIDEFWQLMSELSADDSISPELLELWNAKEAKDNPAGAVNWDKLTVRLQQQIKEQEIEIDYERIMARPSRSWVTWVAAACLLGIILLSWWLIDAPKRPQPVIVTTKMKKAGHQVINLPDGTVVTLNYDSKLDYPPAFNGNAREVYLNGEAFFDIKQDAKKPFLVHTSHFVTTVLGTSFNIKAYGTEPNTAVTVASGRVQVQREDNKQSMGILMAGDQLVIAKSDYKKVLIKADLAKVADWKTDDLVFDNIRFDEAAVLLSNHFGVEIRFRNERVRNCRFTGDFNNHTLEESLDIISKMIRSSWQKENDKLIWIDGKNN
jgi:transmembrane sensor